MTVQYGNLAVTVAVVDTGWITVAVTELTTGDDPIVHAGAVTEPSAPVVAEDVASEPPPAAMVKLTGTARESRTGGIRNLERPGLTALLIQTVCPVPATAIAVGL